MVTKEATDEVVRCAESFEYFLRKYVKLRDVRPDGRTKVISWEWWSHHDEAVSDIDTEPRIIILKARQLGFSWLYAALHAWGAIFQKGYMGGVISQTEPDAKEFLRKCKFVVAQLPWTFSTTVDNTEELTFTYGGTIRAFPSTEAAGRGYTFNRMVVDEAAFHAYAEVNYAAYEPATEFGQVIVLSSSGDGEKQAVNDWFEKMWRAAARGENDYKARFYGWNARPGRDEVWYERQKGRLVGRPGAILREYPSTPEEALQSMLGQRFQSEAMAQGRLQVRDPLHGYTVPAGLAEAGATLKVWSLPRAGVPYVMYTDAAEGKGRDYTATVVLEARTLRHVATLRENIWEPAKHGAAAVALHHWYNRGFWGVERAKAEAILWVIGQEKVSRIYKHHAGEGKKPEPGFPVTRQTKTGLIDDLADALATYAITSNDETFWQECTTYIVKPNGGTEASPGNHDDMVMSMAGAVRMARQPQAQSLLGETFVSTRNYME